MTVLAFTVTFHGPFRVGAAYARDGVSAPLDRHDPLPADHLKGIMRAAAAQLFDANGHPAISAVFGSPRTPSPWSWSSAVPVGEGWDFSRRHRVKIDGEQHSAVKDHLVVGEQAWAPAARFTVTRVAMIPRELHDPGILQEAAQVAVLRCAAAGVHGLGAWRRRGLGWVGIAPEGAPVTPADIGILQELIREAEGTRR